MQKNNLLLINSLGIPYFECLEEFSRIIGLSIKLIYLLTNKTESYYSFKEIPKKNGTKRIIAIPSYTLKITQRWILKNILNKIRPSDYAMAFRKSSNNNKFDIKKNAYYHSDSLYGLSIDLSDFFPSINAAKVYRIFKGIGYNNTASAILTNLCTLENKLPQGAVCSPALSNLICMRLDRRLFGLCAKRGVLYTRYADDMYFSCDNKGLLLKMFPIIEKIIKSEGFIINQDKLHYHTPKNKHLITGVVISHSNDTSELKVSKEFKRKIRAEIFRCIMTGNYENAAHIKGEISYVCFIQSENRQDYKQSIIQYINRTSKKIEYFCELVDAYNENFFYDEQEPLEFLDINKLEIDCPEKDIDNYDQYLFGTIEAIFQYRKEYIKNNNLTDICKDQTWPKDTTEHESDVSSEETPF